MAAKDKSLNLGGRPTVITKEVIEKLEYAFSLGCTDLEACLHADISKNALYEYQNKNKEFKERKEQLKQKQILKARMVTEKALDKDDTHTAKWLLEHKKSDEFSKKTDVNTTHTFTQMPTIKLGDKELLFDVGKPLTGEDE